MVCDYEKAVEHELNGASELAGRSRRPRAFDLIPSRFEELKARVPTN